MTVSDRDNLKKNLPTWLTFANFILLLSFVWYQAQWQKGIEANQERFRDHIENRDYHMKYQEKTKLFMPRNEIEIQLLNIQQVLLEIKQDVKNIERQ